jgi:hypothetical protein
LLATSPLRKKLFHKGVVGECSMSGRIAKDKKMLEGWCCVLEDTCKFLEGQSQT